MKSSRNIFRRFSKSSLTEQLLKFDAEKSRQRILTRGIFILTAAFFSAVLFTAGSAQPAGSYDAMRGDHSSISGTVTLEIPSGNGKVRVILPDDIRPGDTISGTVSAAQGVVEGEVVAIKTVEGEVVASKKIGPSSPDQTVTFTVPQGASSLILSCTGKHIPAVQFKVNTDPSGNLPAQPGSFAPPRLGQTGRDITIPGNFDGNAANTTVNIGGKEIPVLAESPRQAAVKIPSDIPTGKTNLTVGDGPGNSRTTPFNVASIELKADKLNLMKGETTNLHISVTGLEGLKDNSGNIRLQIENASPQTVSLTSSPLYQSNGNAGAMPTRAVNADGGNTIAFTEQLTGVNPGNFQINASIIDFIRKFEEMLRAYWRDQLRAIADAKDAAAAVVQNNSKAIKKLQNNAKYLRDVAGADRLWDGGKDDINLKKLLADEKKELDEIQKAIGAGSPAGVKIGEAKIAIDKLLR
ncbi:MAG TPA: hypothetical protein VGO50_09600 [Pyrinomonadaceae bacterium]|jgi:uncharacterized protein (TIGR03437 family)|nr:hypothetical protein [Pyrinomonadaceae bacterium]